MVILGIDPGIAIMGYGWVEESKRKLEVIDYGVVTTPARMKTSERLVRIYEAVDQLISQYKPDAVAVEELFFNKNVKTALIVGHARGVSVLAAARRGIPLYEYTPLQV